MDNKDTESKLANWKNKPTVEDLRRDYNSAASYKSEHVAKIDKWLDLLHATGTAAVKPRHGRSKVQPKLIRKQAEWRYTALSEPFLSNPNIFEVSPRTWKDREAASQNGLILNYQFNNQINKTKLIDTLIRALVNEGVAIARVYWQYEEHTVKETLPIYEYSEADEQSNAMLTQLSNQVKQQPDLINSLPPELRESLDASIENQRPIVAKDTGKTEEVESIKVLRNQPAVEICNVRNVTIDPTCGGDPDRINFIVYSYEASRSDLERTGLYTNLDKISDASTMPNGEHIEIGDPSFRFSDKPRQKLTVYEYWGFWDIDDTGVTKPIIACWVDDVMIRLEENPYPHGKLPFVIIPYLPVADSVYGEADAELLEDNQKLIGALIRGQIDAMAKSANSQIGMRKDALDFANLRKYRNGEDYMFNPNVDPRAAVIEHTYPELPASSFNMLQMFNMEAEAITGIKAFTGGISGDSLGSTATGVRGVIDAQGKRELGILRRVADGLSNIAKLVLAMNGAWLSDEEVVRVTDVDFVAINRDNLAGAFDVKLSISNSQTDDIKAQELSFMLQTMGAVLPFPLLQLILAQIAELRSMPDLAKVIKDYKPEPDPKAELESQKLELELQKLHAEVAKLQTEVEMLTPAKAQWESARAQSEMAKAEKAQTEAELNKLNFVEQETGTKQERALQLAQAQAQGNIKRDITQALLNVNQSTNQGDK